MTFLALHVDNLDIRVSLANDNRRLKSSKNKLLSTYLSWAGNLFCQEDSKVGETCSEKYFLFAIHKFSTGNRIKHDFYTTGINKRKGEKFYFTFWK